MGSNEIQDILTELAHGRDLPEPMAERAFQILMSGGATPAQIAAFVMGLRIKGETVTEIIAGARVLRQKAATFTAPEHAIDTCGTGGDGSRTLNISTAVAIVTAACGVPVAKHGNRAVTSASGSSDVLEALGINVRATAEQSQTALEQIGLCFLMAPLYHKAVRHVAPVRQELGLRTIFNLLGPLANPAGTKRQLIGVYSERWLEPVAEALHALGSTKAWIVHGRDGMDEITTTTLTDVAMLQDGVISRLIIDPADYDIEYASLANLSGQDAEYNAKALRQLLGGMKGPYRDIVLLNTAAALCVADAADDLHHGMRLAAEAIDDGRARNILAQLAEVTRHA
ncbi:MAG: anthranilate phosphoribosyltransferase [Rickettsiales bacterium]|nr:anthranilate phosphoribosyltransferase [Rickettsiales bacterium]